MIDAARACVRMTCPFSPGRRLGKGTRFGPVIERKVVSAQTADESWILRWTRVKLTLPNGALEQRKRRSHGYRGIMVRYVFVLEATRSRVVVVANVKWAEPACGWLGEQR